MEKIKLKRKLASAILLKSVTYTFALFGLLSIFLLFVLVGILGGRSGVASVPDDAIMFVNLDAPYDEIRRDSLLTEMGGKATISFADLLINIELAAGDERIKALAAKISTPALGLAQMQELKKSISYFRSQGKKAYLYSSAIGEMGGGTAAYYLAGAFDEIVMMPHSDIGMTGISLEVPFFREVLDKLGIFPEFYARYEHKNAMASFTDKKASKTIYDDFKKLVDTLNGFLFEEILHARFSQASNFDAAYLMNRSPMSAEAALNLGLIDKLAYEASWRASLKEEYKAEYLDIADYAMSWHFAKGEDTVAFLVLDGVISSGKSVSNPVNGEAVIGSDTVLEQINEIAEDKNVKAVVVRVNSPGGSYAASSEIRHALVRLKETKKIPLIISMGNYAASGGYMIALAGDWIFADSATITGSIGVLGGKPVLEKLWQKLGVNWMMIETSQTSGWMSANRPFNEIQKKIFNQALDRVYEDFTSLVAKSRDIDLKKLDKLARGRVWLGLEAQQNGLIDEIGGLSEAVGYAKKQANIVSDKEFSVSFYPKPRTLQEKIAELTDGMRVSAPEMIKSELGLDISSVNMLKRLQYDAVLVPFLLK